MTKYLLIRGDQVIARLDCDAGDVVALPLLGGGEPLSLLNERHAQNLMVNLGLSAAEALQVLGLGDLQSTTVSAVALAPVPAEVTFAGVAYRLIQLGSFGLWQVVGQIEDLLTLHERLWVCSPSGTFGLLAAVQEFGVAFYEGAIRAHTGMTVKEARERRDRIAAYLEANGYPNTAALRTAADEHGLMIGLCEALGYTEAELWDAMVA